MKLPYYLLASALCLGLAIGACSDGPTDVASEAALSAQDDAATAKKEVKVDICHWDENGWDNLPRQTEPGAFFHLNVNDNSWGAGDKKNPNNKDVGHNGHVRDQWYCFPRTSLDNNGEPCTEESDREKLTIGPDDLYNAILCEDDFDGDGYSNDSDNCPFTYNPDQTDTDGGGVGDACDSCPDSPRDGDNQVDTDGDGVGDSCDNCIATPNPDQANADGDRAGDLCDDCDADPAETVGTDGDADGWCSNDCDDGDGAINPDATEVCDGADNDCDDDVDEGGVCPYPTCQGDTWAGVGNVGDFPCDDTQCSTASYCGEVAEGGGTCVSLVTSTCGGGACTATSECPSGAACVVNTLCGAGVCMTADMLCEDPQTALRPDIFK